MPAASSYPLAIRAPGDFVLGTNAAGAVKRFAESGREVIYANRTYYVRTDGSDSNDGLSNTSGGAFLTLQHAIDVASALASPVYYVKIVVGPGTRTEAIEFRSHDLNYLWISGDVATPSNCVFNTTGATVFNVAVNGSFYLEGFRVSTSGTGYGLSVFSPGAYVGFGDFEFGPVASGCVSVQGGFLYQNTACEVLAGAHRAYAISYGPGAQFTFYDGVTCTGTPSFDAFVSSGLGGTIEVLGGTFSGAATGKRYDVANGGIIETYGGGTSYFPGSLAGTGTNFGASPWGLYE